MIGGGVCPTCGRCPTCGQSTRPSGLQALYNQANQFRNTNPQPIQAIHVLQEKGIAP